jgi:hypothetical protein
LAWGVNLLLSPSKADGVDIGERVADDSSAGRRSSLDQ